MNVEFENTHLQSYFLCSRHTGRLLREDTWDVIEGDGSRDMREAGMREGDF